MKKYAAMLLLSCFGLSLSSAPICAINQELNKDTVSQLSDFRKQTISTCLTCTEGS